MSEQPLSAVRRPALRGLVAAIGALHLLGCLHYFPAAEIFSGEPLLTGDYGQRFLEAERVARYLRHGSFVGYCTTWMAGFPDGLIGLINNKPFELLLALTPDRSHPLVFNLATFAMLWGFPILIYRAAREFDRTAPEAALSMTLAMIAFYGSVLFRVFWRGGTIMFMFGSVVGLWASGRAYRRWSTADSAPGWQSVAFLAGLVPWIHAAALPVVVFGAASAHVATFRQRGWRVAEGLKIASTVVAMNSFWILPYLRHAKLVESFYYGLYQGGLGHLAFDFVTGPLHLASGPREETGILLPVTLLAAVGLHGERRPLRMALGSLALSLAALAYGGSQLKSTAELQPYRFVVPLVGILAIAAGAAGRGIRRDGRVSLACAVLFIVAMLVSADRIRVARHAADYLGTGLSQGERWALETLRAAAGPSGAPIEGRVLLEGDFWSELVPGRRGARRVSYSFIGFERYLRGEFFGADVIVMTLPERYAEFWQGRWLGRTIESFDREAFLRSAALYDVRWIVTARRLTKEALSRFEPDVHLIAENGPIGIFGLPASRGRVVAGDAEAASDGERILVTAHAPGRVTVAYHWIPGLVARPPAPVQPTPIEEKQGLFFVSIDVPAGGRYVIGLGE